MKEQNRVNGWDLDAAEEVTSFEFLTKLTAPGSTKTHALMLTFKMVSFSELQELEQRNEDDEDPSALAKELVLSWPQAGSKHEDKTFKTGASIVPVTAENKARIFNDISVARQTLETFFRAQGGKKQR